MNFELDNGLLSITGVDHNKSIPANSSVNFGMIIINAGELDSAKATLIVREKPSLLMLMKKMTQKKLEQLKVQIILQH